MESHNSGTEVMTSLAVRFVSQQEASVGGYTNMALMRVTLRAVGLFVRFL